MAFGGGVRGLYDYLVPPELAALAEPGSRVRVHLGRRQATGFIVERSHPRTGSAGNGASARSTSGPTADGVAAGDRPGAAIQAAPRELLSLDEVLDSRPLLAPGLLTTLLRAADYYLEPVAELLRAALPAGLAREARQYLRPTPLGREALARGAALLRPAELELRPDEELLLRLAGRGVRGSTLAALGRELRGAAALAARLRRRGLLEATWRGAATPTAGRGEEWVSLARPPTEQELAALSRTPARAALLDRLQQPSVGGATVAAAVPLAALRRLDPRARVHVQALRRQGLLEVETRGRHRGDDFAALTVEPDRPPRLNPAQQTAVAAIRAAMAAGDHPRAGSAGDRQSSDAGHDQRRDAGRNHAGGDLPHRSCPDGYAAFLLHGVTGSGKTEVYLQAIATTLARGRDGLVLVPEISLTPQLAARFRARFGDQVAVLHSGLTAAERADEWHRLRHGKARVALGARSAVFAPLPRLGVVVVDEEHEASFKQEQSPRYHARDLALLRAHTEGAVAILGSATPSLESLHGARSGRLTLLSMPERATPLPLPRVEIVDLRRCRPERATWLSPSLAEALEATLAASEQAILFLNRRGFTTQILCAACGHTLTCRNCSVSLTYHRARDLLLCHTCGLAEHLPEACPACGDQQLQHLGLGTERLEHGLRQRLPRARIARLDRDTATPGGLRRLLAAMRDREIDILVGTQLVAKGHDFAGVTLVGVLCADLGLGLPDFRASERTFQLLTQVAGRAGRGDRPGQVIIQTYNPTHPAVISAAEHDCARFAAQELAQRAELSYPPFGRLCVLRVDGRDPASVEAVAQHLAQAGRDALAVEPARFGLRLLGPAAAPLSRLRGRTRWQLLLLGQDRDRLRALAARLRSLPLPSRARDLRVSVDVDPMSLL